MKRLSTLVRAAIVFSAALVLASCGGGGDSSAPSTVTVQAQALQPTVTATATPATLPVDGGIVQFDVTVQPPSGVVGTPPVPSGQVVISGPSGDVCTVTLSPSSSTATGSCIGAVPAFVSTSTNAISANYSGDQHYKAATGTLQIGEMTLSGTYSVSGTVTDPSGNVSPWSGSSGSFTGTLWAASATLMSSSSGFLAFVENFVLIDGLAGSAFSAPETSSGAANFPPAGTGYFGQIGGETSAGAPIANLYAGNPQVLGSAWMCGSGNYNAIAWSSGLLAGQSGPSTGTGPVLYSYTDSSGNSYIGSGTCTVTIQ